MSGADEIPRVPAGYMDDDARLWTMSFTRTAITSLSVACNDNQNSIGQIYYTTVPLPPTG